MNEMDYARQRQFMILEQLEARGIADEKVLQAMQTVRRELFVPEDIRSFAYHDGPLPIDCGQTISQPYIVACMAEFLDLSPDERVLEIGTGSGYNAAVLSLLAKEVYTIEIHEILAREAKELLASLNYNNVFVKQADGYLGWKEKAPFDAIILTAAPSKTPQELFDQLAEGGRLVAPEGEDSQFLFLYKKKNGQIEKNMLMPVKFMPMVGPSHPYPGIDDRELGLG